MTSIKLEDLNDIIIESDTVSLHELNKGDSINNIKNIVNAYSMQATAVLYNQSFLKDRNIFKQEIQAYDSDGSLNNLKRLFEQTQLRNQFEYFCGKSAIRHNEHNEYRQHINTIKNALFPNNENIIFSPYGPLQKISDGVVNEYISKAIKEREKQKRLFYRFSIMYEGRYIGGFVFDFIYDKFKEYNIIGDIGIFIDPEHRGIRDNSGNIRGRIWRDTFFVFSIFLKNVFPLFKKHENTHISATTHPLNMETGGILSEKYKFKYKGIIPTSYGKRKFYLIGYDDFIETFAEKQKNVDFGVQASYVKLISMGAGGEKSFLL